ncbi:hypothetical protein HDV00_004072 [Rhizophlyctis rosea]|nr:hypothetical protein HDV00_004072 [Rhizophlyctis rosea]
MTISSPVSKVPKPPAYYKDQENAYGHAASLSSQTHPGRKSPTSPAANIPMSTPYAQPGGYHYSAAAYYTPPPNMLDPSQSGKDLERPKSVTRRPSVAGQSGRKRHFSPEHDGIPYPADEEREDEHGFLHDGDGYKSAPSRKRKKSLADGLGREVPAEPKNEAMEKAKEEAKKRQKPGEMAVVNDNRLQKAPQGVTEKYLGHVIYTGPRLPFPSSSRISDIKLFLLPQFTSADHYATIEVRIPAELLTFRGNIALKKQAAWGTLVYTDDSDVVAMIVHAGWYRPIDAPNPLPPATVGNGEKAVKVESLEDDERPTDVEGQSASQPTPSLALSKSYSYDNPPLTIAKPDPRYPHLPSHDVHVTLRILPRLIKYSGSMRNGLQSRGWGGGHDGESLEVVKVVEVERGSVNRSGRKIGARGWTMLARMVAREIESIEELGWSGETLLTEWPPNLQDILEPTLSQQVEDRKGKRRASLAGNALPLPSIEEPNEIPRAEFTRDELEQVKDWPYWRVRLLKDNLILEGDGESRFEIMPHDGQVGQYAIAEQRVSADPTTPAAVPEIVSEADLRWTTAGLRLKRTGRVIETLRFFWRRRGGGDGVAEEVPQQSPANDKNLGAVPTAASEVTTGVVNDEEEEEEEEEVIAEGVVPLLV